MTRFRTTFLQGAKQSLTPYQSTSTLTVNGQTLADLGNLNLGRCNSLVNVSIFYTVKNIANPVRQISTIIGAKTTSSNRWLN